MDDSRSMRAVGNPPGHPRLARLARPACLARLASEKLCAQRRAAVPPVVNVGAAL